MRWQRGVDGGIHGPRARDERWRGPAAPPGVFTDTASRRRRCGEAQLSKLPRRGGRRLGDGWRASLAVGVSLSIHGGGRGGTAARLQAGDIERRP